MMAGSRIPSNKERSELSMLPAEHEIKYYSMGPRAYQPQVTEGQKLYTQVWDKVNDYFALSRAQQPIAAPLTTRNANLGSSRSDVIHGAYHGAARNVDSTTDFGVLIKSETDLNASGMEDESGAVVPTIQFDLGSNFLGCSAQPDTMPNFAAPYSYPGNSSGRVDSRVHGGQPCLPGDPSLAANLWNESFDSSSRNASSASMENVPTVDYTTRWEGSNNLNDTPVSSQGSLASEIEPISEPFEGRLSPYLAEPSPLVAQRIELALKQRQYVIEKNAVTAGDSENPVACEFRVLGSTGSLHTVRISIEPSCTCADSEQGSCVHILFILLRVMKVSVRDYRLWQTALTPREAVPLLKQAMMDDGGLGLVRQRMRMLEMLGQGGVDPRQGELREQLRSLEREMKASCPACFEPMTDEDGTAKEEMTFCRSCSSDSMHKDCFEKWMYVKQDSEDEYTCSSCRSPWYRGHDGVGAGILKKRKADPDSGQDGGGYANLADFPDDPRGPDDMPFGRLYPHSRPKLDRGWGGG